ncbi:MAG: hypothetical protein HYR98_05400 [Nitrospirae bacterium]|nr:hypothetical protein [Nitrospirota bacterium]
MEDFALRRHRHGKAGRQRTERLVRHRSHLRLLVGTRRHHGRQRSGWRRFGKDRKPSILHPHGRERPEGEKGDLVSSLRSYEIYYESWGKTWERAALIKARPIAGDASLGEEFLTLVRPFVYRKYLDFGALTEIRDMKFKIDQSLAARRAAGINIKLGTGGIREIEFLAQTFQLIYGGRDPSIRERSTVPALRAIARRGMLSSDERDALVSAYYFLRSLEHQRVRGRTAHGRLPPPHEDGSDDLRPPADPPPGRRDRRPRVRDPPSRSGGDAEGGSVGSTRPSRIFRSAGGAPKPPASDGRAAARALHARRPAPYPADPSRSSAGRAPVRRPGQRPGPHRGVHGRAAPTWPSA